MVIRRSPGLYSQFSAIQGPLPVSSARYISFPSSRSELLPNIHGSSTVLYCKPRNVSFPSQSLPTQKPLPSQAPQSKEKPKLREEPQQRGKSIARALTPPQFTTKITIRLQMDMAASPHPTSSPSSAPKSTTYNSSPGLAD